MNEVKIEGIPFYIVDVFAVDKYSGNQLAVVISRNKLNGEEMQRIAKEMNYSETTFVTSVENYEVRIFFCGASYGWNGLHLTKGIHERKSQNHGSKLKNRPNSNFI
ncbi:MAG: PhzF family phenazine biosynthesis protein [Promethearchaeota archaeon]